jgi:integrase
MPLILRRFSLQKQFLHFCIKRCIRDRRKVKFERKNHRYLQGGNHRPYYARMAVPVALRGAIGKRELIATLGPDYRDALKMLPGVVAEMKAQISAARREATGRVIHRLVTRPDPLSTRQMAAAHYASELEADRARRFDPVDDERLWSLQRTAIEAARHDPAEVPPAPLPDTPDYNSLPPGVGDMTQFHPAYRAALAHVASGKADTDEAKAVIGWAIDVFRQRGNTTIQDGTPEWRKLAADLASIQLEIVKRGAERDAGNFADKSDHPLLTVQQPSPADPVNARKIGPDSAKPLSALLDAFINERKASSLNEWEHRVTIRMFEEAHGEDMPAYRVTRQHVHAFKRALAEAPLNYTKRFPSTTLPDAIKRNSARKAPYPTLSAKTVNDKYLSKLHAFFAWCIRNDIIPDNPAASIKVDIVGEEGGRVDFKPNDLVRIFAKDRFATDGKLDEFEWATLISLFSGLRASELAQVQLDSVRNERGILVFAVEEFTKNKGSKRLVPVHSTLTGLGLEKHVTRLRKQGHTHLFPDWYARGMDAKGKADRGDAAATLNHYFPRFIPKAFNRSHLPAVGIDDRRKSWHSFRHTFKTGLARAGVTKSIRDELCGHADYSAGALYIHDTSVEAAREAVERLKFDGLDLSRLSKSVHSQ